MVIAAIHQGSNAGKRRENKVSKTTANQDAVDMRLRMKLVCCFAPVFRQQ
jgi:hypothetical protein